MSKIIEDEHYYNNCYKVIDGILEFERVYMVDEYQFNKETYEMLGKVYKSLPCYLRDHVDSPHWYGCEEKGDPYFISVSFEMSGLQFWGKVPITQFSQWEKALHKGIEDFPFKYQV
ncbi:hypothetical protein [Priestia filamentosa]|uniref:hypothetical protein n=1 Tax=Priestia filamentosa TaxID=1402861 RepID=UPI002E2062B6|nr:hypothetical protein [Priestia filamentosa]